MLTIFSTPKPFVGHSDVIQRNAIKSWTLLHPNVEIILFGDEIGTAEVCKEYRLRHEPLVLRSPSGAKYLDHIFAVAQRTAKHRVVCYVNCDILLTSDFCAAVCAVAARRQKFLMVGQRWDTPITAAWNFSAPAWQVDLQKFGRKHGHLVGPFSIDYFAFPRGLFDRLPPLVIGRCWWDHWLVWKARSRGGAIVDATPGVMAIHQNHDYAYHPHGFLGTLRGEEALENIRLAGGKGHLQSLLDATHELTPAGKIRRVHFRKPVFKTRKFLRDTFWDLFIYRTFALRKRLGLCRRTSSEHAAAQV
jgi:hypothetical protein